MEVPQWDPMLSNVTTPEGVLILILMEVPQCDIYY